MRNIDSTPRNILSSLEHFSREINSTQGDGPAAAARVGWEETVSRKLPLLLLLLLLLVVHHGHKSSASTGTGREHVETPRRRILVGLSGNMRGVKTSGSSPTNHYEAVSGIALMPIAPVEPEER
jgi:hypothetical protein